METKEILIAWDGNGPLTVLESILKDSLHSLYGFQNVRQFTSSVALEEYLESHLGLHKRNAGIMVIYSPSKEEDISRLFNSSGKIKKVLVMVTRHGLMPSMVDGHDQYMIIDAECCKDCNEQPADPVTVIRRKLKELFGEPNLNQLSAEELIELSEAPNAPDGNQPSYLH